MKKCRCMNFEDNLSLLRLCYNLIIVSNCTCYWIIIRGWTLTPFFTLNTHCPLFSYVQIFRFSASILSRHHCCKHLKRYRCESVYFVVFCLQYWWSYHIKTMWTLCNLYTDTLILILSDFEFEFIIRSCLMLLFKSNERYELLFIVYFCSIFHNRLCA